MKLSVLQASFSQALTNASRFANTRAQLPVLGNILLSTKKTKLLIASTNLELSYAGFIGSQVKEEGDITVPGKIISEIISNLSAGNVDLTADKEILRIDSSGFTSKVAGMNASDFPSLPQKIDSDNAIVFPKDSFIKSLSQVVFATSPDDTRPILTGVLFIFHDDSITLVATDGFRLSQKKVPLVTSAPKTLPSVDQVIVPKTALGEVARLFSGDETLMFNYRKSDNQVLFGNTETILSSRVLEGEFPNFEKIIPKTSTIKVIVDKEDLARGIKLASVFARDSANIVKIKIDKSALAISAESQSVGSQQTTIEAKVEGEGFEIAFNYRFLEDYLHAALGDEIRIEMSDPNAPAVFLDTTDTNFLHLIMPVKIQG